MISTPLILAGAVLFVAGMAFAVYMVMVISIHRTDRQDRLHKPPRGFADALTRRVLGTCSHDPGRQRRDAARGCRPSAGHTATRTRQSTRTDEAGR